MVFLKFRRNPSFSSHPWRCAATFLAQAVTMKTAIDDMRKQGNRLTTNNRELWLRNREGRLKVRKSRQLVNSALLLFVAAAVSWVRSAVCTT